MSSIQVRGLRPLSGKITVQGSKNAALPVMAAALLARGITVIRNVPVIADVLCMMEILESLGCGCRFENHVMEIDATEVTGVQIPEALVGKMRSSVIVLGPLLSRMGEAWTMFPGGCVLGKRPVDLHLSAFRALGAKTMEAGGVIVAQAGRTESASGIRAWGRRRTL